MSRVYCHAPSMAEACQPCDFTELFCFVLWTQEYQKVVDAEWTILYNKLEKIVSSGAKVVLSKLPIGDVATQYFADR